MPALARLVREADQFVRAHAARMRCSWYLHGPYNGPPATERDSIKLILRKSAVGLPLALADCRSLYSVPPSPGPTQALSRPAVLLEMQQDQEVSTAS